MRVLVVEDEVRLARALQKGLRAEGFAVDLVHDGPAGLDSARQGSYDAVVLDIMLPGLSGYEVVRTLRRGAEKITGGNSAGTLPLPDSADEIRRLAETLNDMLARLETSRRRQRAFVADAAHELRSPLTSLRVQLEVAAATGEDADTGDLLTEVDRLGGLVEDLLLLAKVDDGRPPPKMLVDPVELATEVTKRYAGARIPVELRASPAPAVEVDPGALRRVLANLLDNATRYATATITLTVDPADGGTRLSVVDDGPGIAPTDRELVFERFTRLQHARDRDSGGSGLGLAIVRELITQQGGSVTLDDTVPGGDPPCLLYTSPSPRDGLLSRMPSSA